jgi:hydrogenase small subunit
MMEPQPPTLGSIGAHLERCRVSRRDLLGFCSKLMVAAPFGLAIANHRTPEAVAAAVASAPRVPVIWLHLQDCTGCTETLLRTSKPDLADLIFHLISLDYHETVMAASGHDAEAALHTSLERNEGRLILVVEGSIPTKGPGYMQIAGKPAIQLLREASEKAAAIVAIGSCASWGGVPSASPNPTGAVGVGGVLRGRPVVNLPGCPPNPYTLLGVILEYAKFGTLPELDKESRPKFAYDRLIHDHCPRRGHFDAGRFADEFGDEGHRQGYCLYKLGCKGPDTHAGCSTRHFNEVVGAWPIGIGAPCYGCTEKHLAFQVPLHQTIPIYNATPPIAYPSVATSNGRISPLATGLVGIGVGAVGGATWVAAQRFSNEEQASDGAAQVPDKVEGSED